MTKEQLSKMTIPMPFAGGNGASVYDILKPSGTRPNFEDGFPANYSAPQQAGGSFILRSEMNGLGKMASMNQWFQQAGGYYTFDTEWCNAQSPAGYPKDAILHHISSGMLVAVRSLVDNNTWDFRTSGIDGVHWEVCTPSALMFPIFDTAQRDIIWTNDATVRFPTSLASISGDIPMPFDGFVNYVSNATAVIPAYDFECIKGISETNGILDQIISQRVPVCSRAAITGCMMGVILGITSPKENGEADDVILNTSNPYSGDRNCAVFTVDGLGLGTSGAGAGPIPCKKGSKIKVFAKQTFSNNYLEPFSYRITTKVPDGNGGYTGAVTESEELKNIGSGSCSCSISLEAYPITNRL